MIFSAKIKFSCLQNSSFTKALSAIVIIRTIGMMIFKQEVLTINNYDCVILRKVRRTSRVIDKTRFQSSHGTSAMNGMVMGIEKGVSMP